MKQVNINLSVLYNIQIASDYNFTPVCLAMPTVTQGVHLAYKTLKAKGKAPNDLFELIKSHIALDQFQWACDVIKLEGCP